MLLLWYLSMIQFSHSHLGEEVFTSSLLSRNQLFFVSGRISPQVLRCFHKPTTSLCFSLLISSSIIQSSQAHVQFRPFIAGVLSAFFRAHSLLIPFQPEWLHVLPCRWSYSFMSFNLHGSSKVPCSSFLSECF